jgi:hypothetical protein
MKKRITVIVAIAIAGLVILALLSQTIVGASGLRGKPTKTPTPIPAPTATPLPIPTPGPWWHPAPGTTWQWQLTGVVDQSYNVQMYDIDVFDNDASVVAALHAAGRVVIAYIEAGDWNVVRPDADQFPESVLCGTISGWPDERWMDIRQIDVLGPLIGARMDMAVQKGFDGIEPDCIDAYANNNGCSGTLTYQDQITYNTWLASQAHARNLSVGLKGDIEQAFDLQPYFDWTLNEQCFQYNECDWPNNGVVNFIDAGKAVFQVEYKLAKTKFCPQANAWGFSSMKKNLNLDAWMDPCW